MSTYYRITCMVLLLAAISGCQPSYCRQVLDHTNYPPDFALIFHIECDNESETRPEYRNSQYILEPDRFLRVALGQGAQENIYPKKTTRLQPCQMEDIYQHIRNTGLLQYKDNDQPDMTADIRYHLTITAYDVRHVFITTPLDSPTTKTLLVKLIQIGGIDRFDTASEDK